ncbi:MULTISPECIES: helix-turn-helix domain-containing protein [unclassified Bradyrhizobium]|uniref:helix-turn-helix domain-containing protein n=1 Tax=unclassified Bradyrhizobium TaxID=2631580 RepID=UPI002478B7C0|nr:MULTISPECIES: helix-turn-helix domain-containing protein [unclassified Bradyrhizobium]WGR70424.1 helix-turn-helix domain-containing protein [Bradyrhizobium sp. ISRA426]WGR82480.1 helix-turn-helix domain-containing protein [Bradyrhizobium sp. ISRA430]WGR85666.1 helix-turn-helix domain-containing protein [Bradyrhizobium sp. ISRA432]
MVAATRAPNLVPNGAIRLSEAFDRLCARLDPEWAYLPELCVQWDERIARGDEDLGGNPYHHMLEIEFRAERMLRWALFDGELCACVHHLHTGVDLELYKPDWWRMGRSVGLHSDYTDDHMLGPDCQLDGVPHPIFLSKEAFENWLGTEKQLAVTTQRAASHEAEIVRDTVAFSLEEIAERTGLSRSTLYKERDANRLIVKKCGDRTLVLESDLDRFLRNLPSS